MSDAPIDILRRLAERKKAYREYEINEFNEITPLPEPPATSGHQPADGAPDEAVGTDEINEFNEITPSATAPKDPAAPIVSPARWAGIAADELPFDEPCPERRGLIERHGALFLHFCVECGRWGAYGYGRDRPGRWYCRQHRPDEVSR